MIFLRSTQSIYDFTCFLLFWKEVEIDALLRAYKGRKLISTDDIREFSEIYQVAQKIVEQHPWHGKPKEGEDD